MTSQLLAIASARRAAYVFREMRSMPLAVALYVFRARELARARGDDWALTSGTGIPDLKALLEVAAPFDRVVELGTAIGWTTGALALARKSRQVVSFDPMYHQGREAYMALLPQSAHRRITLVNASGSVGPQDGKPVDMVFIDTAHIREETVKEFNAWKHAVRPGGVIAFHDYTHPEYPGVREAIDQDLSLTGDVYASTMFLWRKHDV